jgi:Ca2+-binding RTX toxin-like protein
MALKNVIGTYRDDADLRAPINEASYIAGSSGNDRITGSSLNDIINGGEQDYRLTDYEGAFRVVGDNDTIDAGAGDDVIYVGAGNDKIYGGSGLDSAIFAFSALFMIEVEPGHYGSTRVGMSSLFINLASATYSAKYVHAGKLVASVTGIISNVEKVTGSGYDDTLIGSGADEYFRPIGGSDTIVGGGGFDILRYDNSEIGMPETYGIIVDFALGCRLRFGVGYRHRIEDRPVLRH